MIKVGSEESMTKREQAILARFRTGHTPDLAWYRALITHTQDEPESGLCEGCGKTETLKHYLTSCPSTEDDRYSIFGTDDPMEVMFTEPQRVADFIRKSGLVDRD